MTDENREPESEHDEGKVPDDKKPYVKPSYRSEQVFERLALSCGKISPVQFQCRFNRKSS